MRGPQVGVVPRHGWSAGKAGTNKAAGYSLHSASDSNSTSTSSSNASASTASRTLPAVALLGASISSSCTPGPWSSGRPAELESSSSMWPMRSATSSTCSMPSMLASRLPIARASSSLPVIRKRSWGMARPCPGPGWGAVRLGAGAARVRDGAIGLCRTGAGSRRAMRYKQKGRLRAAFLFQETLALLLHGTHRQRHVAQVDMPRGPLVPLVAAIAARFHQLGESRRVRAQQLQRHAVVFRYLRCKADRLDRGALFGLLVETERTGAARQHREQFDALDNAAHHGDVAVELARRLAGHDVQLGAVAGI